VARVVIRRVYPSKQHMPLAEYLMACRFTVVERLILCHTWTLATNTTKHGYLYVGDQTFDITHLDTIVHHFIDGKKPI